MSERTETTDVRGNAVRVGDTVGGSVFGRYPDTIWGEVIKVTPSGSVRVKVEHGSGGYRPSPGDLVLLPRFRIFKLTDPDE